MIARKLVIAAVAAASLVTANVGTVTPAFAGHDGDVAAGAAAGRVGGMLLGGALANSGRVPEEEVVVRRRPARVYEEEEVVRIFAETAEALGHAPDCLVNNAGSMIKRSLIAEMETAVWDRVYAVNMRSVFLCSRQALKTMIPNRGGVIINVSSIGAYTGGGPGSAAYASTKGAMNTFTVGLAREVARYNIRVMAVGPGVIETPFHEKFTTPERRKAFETRIPLGRVGRPEDIAPLVILLASDLSSFTTAHHFDITGGM